jgi:ABC-type nitrate/sulfonate/bicarbonate transport system substrate-binding protein
MMFNKKWILVFVILMMALAGCETGVAESPAPELVEVTMMLDWVPNTNHTGLFVAQSKGWYKEAGLAVNIIQAGETPVEQAVASGSAQFGISYQEGVTLARDAGAPVVSVAAVIQHNTSGFASRADRNITRPKDFEGKTYGGWGSPIETAMLKLLMSCDGGDAGTVNIIDTGFADFFAITEKEIDFAWIFYGWDGINAELKNIDLNVIMLNEWQTCAPDYYTPVIITGEKMIAEQPDMVQTFVQATARGYEYAIANPEEAAQILLAASPESDPDLVTASQKWLAGQYQADASQWGLQKTEVWQAYADWLVEQEILDAPFEAQAAFSNDFLPAKGKPVE